jgi:hypothetical protein
MEADIQVQGHGRILYWVFASEEVAIPGRLELPTYGLGNRRSIRLSYGTADPLGQAGAWDAS